MTFTYKVIRNAVDPQTCELLKQSLHISRDIIYHVTGTDPSNKTKFGDPQCPNSFSISHQVTCEAMLNVIKPIIEHTVNKKLYPTYSCARIYSNGSTLKPHTDNPACEYSATLCIENNPEPWDIFMDGSPVTLHQGDLVVYKGMEVKHWREDLNYDTEITQVFLHYVDIDGPYPDWKYLKRDLLGMPKE